LVLLHEQYLRSAISIWKEAIDAGVNLPVTDDSDYKSMQTLLRHIVRAARGYMTWICEKLDLEDPEINPAPNEDEIENKIDDYLEHILDKWRSPLAQIPEERFYKPVYISRWGTKYCIDAMLEHAVMHPIRHEFQLRKLLTESNSP
jgi:uncharacterized damage-inducible protein DinB